jgi:hypothetical protein
VVPLPYGSPAVACSTDYNVQCKGNPPPEFTLVEFDCNGGKKVEVSDLSFVGNNNDAQVWVTQSNSSVTSNETIIPTVAITSPALLSNSVAANISSYSVSGDCSENGQPVTVSASGTIRTATTNSSTTVTVSPAPTCINGHFTTPINLSTMADGNITITAKVTTATTNGNSATTSVIQYVSDLADIARVQIRHWFKIIWTLQTVASREQCVDGLGRHRVAATYDNDEHTVGA